MASKKKGLSADEKKAKMLELFYESKEFFQLKELEKIAPKQKGVISNSVKEATQMLVDEGLVECEKIGTFVCYWAFPSKALQMRKRKLEDIEGKVNDLKEKIESGQKEITEANKDKEETKERLNLLKEVEEWREKEKTLSATLAIYAEFDPEILDKVRNSTENAIADTNRWTDNIFSIKKWCKGKFGMAGAMLDKHFGIPEDLDYIE